MALRNIGANQTLGARQGGVPRNAYRKSQEKIRERFPAVKTTDPRQSGPAVQPRAQGNAI